ncbi:MAG: hypothetical protein ACK56F_22680 [bacterium]
MEKSFVKMDSIWFLTVARDGYQIVKHHAFMPALPLLLRLI